LHLTDDAWIARLNSWIATYENSKQPAANRRSSQSYLSKVWAFRSADIPEDLRPRILAIVAEPYPC
jgi:hypothetical protein